MLISNLVSWFSDQLNLTTAIAALGFLISVATAIMSILEKHRALRIAIFAYHRVREKLLVTLAIENRSQLPIAVTNIRLLQNGAFISCVPLPVRIATRKRKVGTTVSISNSYSTPLPIQVSPLGAVNCVIYFDNLPESQEDSPMSVTFQICTNRGKAFQTTLALTDAVVDNPGSML